MAPLFEMMRDVEKQFWQGMTLFGSFFFYITAVLVVARFDLLLGARLLALLIIVDAMAAALKLIVQKERPTPLPRASLWQRYAAGSFPSVHAARTAASGVVLWQVLHDPFLATFAGVLALLVAASRIRLRQHDMADIAGGAALGGALAWAYMGLGGG